VLLDTSIIFNTKKGNGVSFMSDNPMWHYRELKGDQRELAMRELKTE
jgi:transketolase